MKEFIYIYLIIGCYFAHRRTLSLDVNSTDFIKMYLKTVFTYPKEIFSKNKETSKNQEPSLGEE